MMLRDHWLRHTALFYLCALLIAACLILGGGTRGGFLTDAILELLAVPILLIALWKLFEIPLSREARLALLLCGAIVLVPLLQLIPLPPGLWTLLPNRELAAEAFALTGGAPTWMPISISPHNTWLAGLSLIPPVAIFVGTMLLGFSERRALTLVIIAVGVVSVFVGLLQVAQGLDSPLRFFEFTNKYEAVGFFANRNHFAAFLYSLVLFSAAWTVNATIAASDRRPHGSYDSTLIIACIGGFTLLVLFLGGQAMARSRAGLGLTMLGLVGAFALGATDRRAGLNFAHAKLIVGAVAVAILFAAQFALYRIMERFDVDSLQGARPLFIQNTAEAAKAYMPLGSGLGSFVSVYSTFEKPEHIIAGMYVNSAHNDPVQIWLEAGLLGAALMALFVIWFAMRCLKVWRSNPFLGSKDIDWTLARAATVVIALLLLHSLFDYPLRTEAMMAIFAFSCALLIEPQGQPETVKQEALRPERRLATRRAEPVPTLAMSRHRSARESRTRPRSTSKQWGTDINWPAEWADSPTNADIKTPSGKPRTRDE